MLTRRGASNCHLQHLSRSTWGQLSLSLSRNFPRERRSWSLKVNKGAFLRNKRHLMEGGRNFPDSPGLNGQRRNKNVKKSTWVDKSIYCPPIPTSDSDDDVLIKMRGRTGRKIRELKEGTKGKDKRARGWSWREKNPVPFSIFLPPMWNVDGRNTEIKSECFRPYIT
jgi:hypothetical protein